MWGRGKRKYEIPYIWKLEKRLKTSILFYCLGPPSIHLQDWWQVFFTLQINLLRSRNEMVSLKYSVSFSKFSFLSNVISAHLLILKYEMCILWHVINVEYEVQTLFGRLTSQKIHSFFTKIYFLSHSFKLLFTNICCINI